jgi:hypothetical protein
MEKIINVKLDSDELQLTISKNNEKYNISIEPLTSKVKALNDEMIKIAKIYFEDAYEANAEYLLNALDSKFWLQICKNSSLSEDFIEEYKDKVDWNWISRYQKLSKEFIEKHLNKIEFYCLCCNENVAPKIKSLIYKERLI